MLRAPAGPARELFSTKCLLDCQRSIMDQVYRLPAAGSSSAEACCHDWQAYKEQLLPLRRVEVWTLKCPCNDRLSFTCVHAGLPCRLPGAPERSTMRHCCSHQCACECTANAAGQPPATQRCRFRLDLVACLTPNLAVVTLLKHENVNRHCGYFCMHIKHCHLPPEVAEACDLVLKRI